ncbi:MarR family transcriptional regulator [Actinomadura sp. DC4]|uniref:MarR family winged helix-turn-helix transcriptional regulator n=1 Tax=Actinomadura sp. DC4 TaxID=3055069 RepID=UPI0025B0108C|nr:MarR family transcriptional regulator [Actinomadura sp. DC4]MDN3353628.1 MarR family transcriptional regulator [Actinomadura sp. DC4]
MDHVAGHRGPSGRVGFLLSQVGALAAAQFADRLTGLGVQPGDVGILRLIAAEEGLSQQTLAGKLGVGPSRVVALIDELEQKGLVVRERSTKDRRTYELRLTGAGRDVMTRMREIGSAHEEGVVHALNASERRMLADLLLKVAESHGLTPDAHPGHRSERPRSY